jgi:fatty acid desaturase
MTTHRLPVNLTDAQIEEFGRELDAIREEVIDSRGERDRQYILRVIKTQRSLALGGRVLIFASILFLPAWGHALASNAVFWSQRAACAVGLDEGRHDSIEHVGVGSRVPVRSVDAFAQRHPSHLD